MRASLTLVKVVFVDSVQLKFDVFEPTARTDKVEKTEEAMRMNLWLK